MSFPDVDDELVGVVRDCSLCVLVHRLQEDVTELMHDDPEDLVVILLVVQLVHLVRETDGETKVRRVNRNLSGWVRVTDDIMVLNVHVILIDVKLPSQFPAYFTDVPFVLTWKLFCRA